MPAGRGSRRSRRKAGGAKKRHRASRGGYRRRDYEAVRAQILEFEHERKLKFKPAAVELIYRKSLYGSVSRAVEAVAALPDPFEQGPAE